ncbi:MAG: YbaB/EbfC family nucleoid-associated protein [Tomitella sp.]|nr:YbaB/EbfC family nucleoid-associated protein [Tomitella sp.]
MQPGGQPDMQQLMAQAQQMQQQMQQAQQELAGRQIQGQAGGGLVKATVSGVGELQSVEIDPSVVDPADVETLQDLVAGAVIDASANAQSAASEMMGPLAGGLGDLGLPGM